MLSQRRQRISNIVCCQSGYFLTADNIFDIHMLFKRENGRFLPSVLLYYLKIPPPSAFSAHGNNCKPPARNNRQPLLPTIIIFFSFYHSLSRQFEALSPGKAGLLKLRQSYGSSVIKGMELSCPKGLLTKYQTVCP